MNAGTVHMGNTQFIMTGSTWANNGGVFDAGTSTVTLSTNGSAALVGSTVPFTISIPITTAVGPPRSARDQRSPSRIFLPWEVAATTYCSLEER